MTRCRVVTGVFRQPGKAVLAASTAALNSSAVVSGIRDTTSCVACDTPTHPPLTVPNPINPKSKKKHWEGHGSRAHGVGDVDVLVGARLDELPADEEAHPRLGRRKARSQAGRGAERSTRNQTEAENRLGDGEEPRARTGVEAGPLESHAAAAAAVDKWAVAGDRRSPGAARVREGGVSQGRECPGATGCSWAARVPERNSAARSMGRRPVDRRRRRFRIEARSAGVAWRPPRSEDEPPGGSGLLGSWVTAMDVVVPVILYRGGAGVSGTHRAERDRDRG